MTEKRQGIFFDLDGTLWDSSESVAESWNRQLAKEGYDAKLTGADMRSVMGLAMDVLAERLLPFVPAEVRMDTAHRCEVFENQWLNTHPGVLYPDVASILQQLQREGYFLGIVSNCQKGYIESFLKKTELTVLFDDYESYGATGLSKAENIQLVQNRNALDTCLYTGDTVMDAQAAAEAGIPFIFAAYGFGDVPAFQRAAVIERFDELPAAVQMLMNKR